MFDEPDVEAQGLRERMAILTVAATTAAGISAGVAAAMPANLLGESGGGGGTTAAFVTDTTSSGPAAEARRPPRRRSRWGRSRHRLDLVTDTTSSGPQASTEAGTVSNLVTDSTSSGPRAVTEEGTVSNLVTDTTSSAGSALEGLTPAQQLRRSRRPARRAAVSNARHGRDQQRAAAPRPRLRPPAAEARASSRAGAERPLWQAGSCS